MEALSWSINLVDDWMKKVGTDTALRKSIVEYAQGQGGKSMMDVTWFRGARFGKLAPSQDRIGWRRFMEGMILKEMLSIQTEYHDIQGGTLMPKVWTKGLVVCLLEVNHGQWLYRNVQVHNTVTGVLATKRKEELQKEIETQIELGGKDWMKTTHSY